MWDVIVLIPDHCLSIYFVCLENLQNIFLLKNYRKKVACTKCKDNNSQ